MATEELAAKEELIAQLDAIDAKAEMIDGPIVQLSQASPR